MKPEYVLSLADARATLEVAGGKGASLARLSNAGLPVPPGITITTNTCNDYYANGGKFPTGLEDDIRQALQHEVSHRGLSKGP